MDNLVMGIFTDIDKAENAIVDLKNFGYRDKEISIIARDTLKTRILNNTDSNPSAADNMLTGATFGAIAGLIAGIAIVSFPPIGGLLIVGPIATTLGVSTAAATAITGAGVGVVGGSLIGSLIGLGLTEDEARIYEEYIQNDGILVSVTSTPESQSNVENIFVENDADEIRTKIGTSRS